MTPRRPFHYSDRPSHVPWYVWALTGLFVVSTLLFIYAVSQFQ